MPAKMTEEHRAINKAATKLRSKAHRRRQDELHAAKEAAKKAVEDGPLKVAADDADAAYSVAAQAARDEVNALKAQIDELNARIAAVRAHHDPIVQEAADKRRAAYDAYYAEERRARLAAEDAFPDMKDGAYYSASQWKPIDEFIPLVETPGPK